MLTIFGFWFGTSAVLPRKLVGENVAPRPRLLVLSRWKIEPLINSSQSSPSFLVKPTSALTFLVSGWMKETVSRTAQPPALYLAKLQFGSRNSKLAASFAPDRPVTGFGTEFGL